MSSFLYRMGRVCAGHPLWTSTAWIVLLGGGVAAATRAPAARAGDPVVGMLVALGVLVLAFGAMVAAGAATGVALLGLCVGVGAVLLLATVADVATSAPGSAAAVGMGVGIDATLLLVTRHTEGLRHYLSPVEAAARSAATAGRAVLVAAVTVAAALLGLASSRPVPFGAYGYATIAAVVVAALLAVTMVPALCALFGVRGARTTRPRRGGDHKRRPNPERRPVVATTVALIVLALLAAPTLAARVRPDVADLRALWLWLVVAAAVGLAMTLVGRAGWWLPARTAARPFDVERPAPAEASPTAVTERILVAELVDE